MEPPPPIMRSSISRGKMDEAAIIELLTKAGDIEAATDLMSKALSAAGMEIEGMNAVLPAVLTHVRALVEEDTAPREGHSRME